MNNDSSQASVSVPQVETRLVYAHGLAAILMLFASLVFGITVSLQLVWPNLMDGSPWHSWGRLRYDHTQGIMLGWLANAFFAFLYHAVPVLTGRRAAAQDLLRESVLTEGGRLTPESDPVAAAVGAAIFTGAMAELAQQWLAGTLGDDLDVVVDQALAIVF